jgi:hypothetical protein
MPLAAGEAQGRIVAEHLHADLGHRLALGRVDLAGHDRGAGLVLRQGQFAQTRARAGAKEADVVGDLEQRRGAALMAPCENTIASWAASASNLLGAVTNGSPVIAATCAATFSAKPTGAFRPVPTAVPPCASS